MKTQFRFLLLLCILMQNLLFSQNNSYEFTLKKAKEEVYNNPEQTIELCKQLLKQENDIQKNISLYMLLSKANIAKRNFDTSLEYILKAKELAQKTNNTDLQASVLIALAIQYQQMELYSKSLETLDEADFYLSKLPETSTDKYLEIARSFAIKGMIYKNQSNSEIALSKFLQSIENFNKVANEKSTYANKSIVFYNIGYCYLDLNKINLAEEAFLHSIEYARKNNAKSLEAFALKGMAEVYKQKNANSKALSLLIQAESLCNKMGDLTLNEGIYKEMADNYLALGNQKLYQKYNRKYFEMRFKREQNELNSINHAIDNHAKEIKTKKNLIEKKYNYYSCIIIIFGVLFLVFIGYFLLKIKSQNRLLKQNIKELMHQ